MGGFIINLRDKEQNQDNYMEWSTIVDAPGTYGMTLEEFKEFYKEEYGNNGMKELERRLERVFEIGTSSRLDKSLDECISCNRAGEFKKGFVPKRVEVEEGVEMDSYSMTKEELLDEYCRPYYKDRNKNIEEAVKPKFDHVDEEKTE